MPFASIEAHRKFLFRVDPYDISWGYTLRTQTIDTYGGRVVQILGVELGNLSINSVAGKGGFAYIREMQKFFREMGLWHQNEHLPAVFNFPYKGYRLSFWGQKFSFENSITNVAYPFQITGMIQEDLSGTLKKSIMTKEIKKLSEGIGYSRNKFNDPEKGSANIAAYERLKAGADPITTGPGTPGAGTPAGNFVFYKQGGNTPWGPTTYITSTYPQR